MGVGCLRSATFSPIAVCRLGRLAGAVPSDFEPRWNTKWVESKSSRPKMKARTF